MAGLELIFFIAAIMRICFGFLLETGLVTQGLITQSQGFC